MSYIGTTAAERYGQASIEASAKTEDANKYYWPIGEITNITRDWKKTEIVVEGSRSVETTAKYHGGLEPIYSAEFKLTNGRCFYLALGNDTASGATTQWEHLIDGTTKVLPYHRIEIIDQLESNSEYIHGCWVDNLSLSATQNDTVNMTMSGVGLDMSSAAASAGGLIEPGALAVAEGGATVDYKGEPYRFQHGSVHIYDSGDKSFDDILHSIDISIANTIKRGPIFGDGGAGNAGSANYHTMSKREITGTITIDVDVTTVPIIRDLVDSETTFELYLHLERTAINDDIGLHFPNCKIFNFPKDYSDSVKAALEFSVMNPDPTTTVTTVGTFASGNLGWLMEMNDTIPDYAETSSI